MPLLDGLCRTLCIMLGEAMQSRMTLPVGAMSKESRKILLNALDIGFGSGATCATDAPPLMLSDTGNASFKKRYTDLLYPGRLKGGLMDE